MLEVRAWIPFRWGERWRGFAPTPAEPGKEAAQQYFQAWILKAYATGIGPLKKLATTMLTHARQILSYFDHPISSGIMEGINNKIGRLTRMAYGYRDDAYFFLKIRAAFPGIPR